MLKEELKGQLLNDDELNKVSGGIQYSISGVDPGDVFLHNTISTAGLVVTAHVDFSQGNPSVPCRSINKYGNQWTLGSACDMLASSIKSCYSFSPELTGTIGY